ncbi:phosphate-starvation-inducible PsiE family protein [uncultured Rhodoblastus sp.]|uniref:phosphate-starvation-inducible PsiE family protein n=1 Tax=uncultured Rhodoblastus sp. TaxID=543037 RepID=UPI0025EDA8E9|nr:phosphate-starvation-inducible PsiE family protein [uncultured Rhodoblastus sp.]
MKKAHGDLAGELKRNTDLRPFNAFALNLMAWLNDFAHLILGLALGASVLLFTWLFTVDVIFALRNDNLSQGFLHGLGTLMLLWTVSALITAEIGYMRGHQLTVDTFVEVAIVVILRKIITMPVQSTLPSPEEFLLWVAAAVLLGVMYLIVRYAQTIRIEEEPKAPAPSEAKDRAAA